MASKCSQGRKAVGLEQMFPTGVNCLTASLETCICPQIAAILKLASSRERAPMLPTSQCAAQLFTQPNFISVDCSLFPSSCPRMPEGLWFLLASLALPAPGYPGRIRSLNPPMQVRTQPSGAGSRPGKGLPPHHFPYCFVNTRIKTPHKLSCLATRLSLLGLQS